MERHGLSLFCVDGDGERFAELFRQTWKQIPLGVRRGLLKRWREMRRDEVEDGHMQKFGSRIPRFELIADKSDFARGNSGCAMGSFNGTFVAEFSFNSRYTEVLSDQSVKVVIAHELGHAACEHWDSDHCSPEKVKYNALGYSESEEDVHFVLSCWGFDEEALYDELDILRAARKDRPASAIS